MAYLPQNKSGQAFPGSTVVTPSTCIYGLSLQGPSTQYLLKWHTHKYSVEVMAAS